MRRWTADAGAVALGAVQSRLLRRVLLVAGSFVLTCSLIVGAAFLALILRLQSGPIEVDWIGQRVAADLEQRFEGVKFSFDATRIARTEHGPTITIAHLQAVAGGRTVVEAPRAELSLDPIALLKLHVMPRRLEVFDLVVRLLVLPDGALAISAGAESADAVVVSHGGVARAILALVGAVKPAEAALFEIWQGKILAVNGGTATWIREQQKIYGGVSDLLAEPPATMRPQARAMERA